MGCQNKSRFTKNQIEIIKFFKGFNVNILRHKKIYGIMVEPDNDAELKFMGFISVPLNDISKDDVIVNNITEDGYAIVADEVMCVDDKFDLEDVEEEQLIVDRCGILSMLQAAVDEELCELNDEVDIVYIEKFSKNMEDPSDDMNER